TPLHGQQFIEGQSVLVQVNAVDDIGIASVSLTVNGLVTGPLTLSDVRWPYEFLLKLSYGQAGQDLQLSAEATELRYQGTPRIVTTPAVRIGVAQDTQAPELIIRQPQAAAMVSE